MVGKGGGGTTEVGTGTEWTVGVVGGEGVGGGSAWLNHRTLLLVIWRSSEGSLISGTGCCCAQSMAFRISVFKYVKRITVRRLLK